MRDILFRGKDKSGRWHYGSHLKATGHWHNRGKHSDWIITGTLQNGGWLVLQGRYAVLPETLGQYTGLKDKNGIKIFEGDILSVSHDFTETYSRGSIEDGTLEVWDEVVDTIDEIAPVVIEKGSATVAEWYLDTFSPEEIEILGNITDNPELMEVGE